MLGNQVIKESLGNSDTFKEVQQKHETNVLLNLRNKLKDLETSIKANQYDRIAFLEKKLELLRLIEEKGKVFL